MTFTSKLTLCMCPALKDKRVYQLSAILLFLTTISLTDIWMFSTHRDGMKFWNGMAINEIQIADPIRSSLDNVTSETLTWREEANFENPWFFQKGTYKGKPDPNFEYFKSLFPDDVFPYDDDRILKQLLFNPNITAGPDGKTRKKTIFLYNSQVGL